LNIPNVFRSCKSKDRHYISKKDKWTKKESKRKQTLFDKILS